MADLHLGGGEALRRLAFLNEPVLSSVRAQLSWQAWRWTAFAVAAGRRGSAFLPRAMTVDARSVARIAERRKLFGAAGTRRLRWLAGRVVGGDWDAATTATAEHPAYRSFYQRYLEGAPWKETEYWSQIAGDVSRAVPRVGCRTMLEVEQKFAGFDALWRVVGTPDYHPSAQGRYRPWEEVLLALGRDGDLLLVDGRHRLILSHLKGCRLPVFLILRHRQAAWPSSKVAIGGEAVTEESR